MSSRYQEQVVLLTDFIEWCSGEGLVLCKLQPSAEQMNDGSCILGWYPPIGLVTSQGMDASRIIDGFLGNAPQPVEHSYDDPLPIRFPEKGPTS